MNQDEQLAEWEQSKAEMSVCPCDTPGLEILLLGRAVDFPCIVNWYKKGRVALPGHSAEDHLVGGGEWAKGHRWMTWTGGGSDEGKARNEWSWSHSALGVGVSLKSLARLSASSSDMSTEAPSRLRLRRPERLEEKLLTGPPRLAKRNQWKILNLCC